jgi:hypothetical protein
MFTLYLHKNSHIYLRFSLVIAMKPEANRRFRIGFVLLFLYVLR